MWKTSRLVTAQNPAMTQDSPRWRAVGLTIGVLLTLAGCGVDVTHSASPGLPDSTVSGSTAPIASTPTSSTSTTTTTLPCLLPSTPGTADTIPVNQVCSSAGAPHFDTPGAAMTYLARAWNADDVQELDYVTNPAGRAQMNSMAALMVDLRFKTCTANPAGDYTCYFTHDIAPSTSPTTYPNPEGFPPGEAVFTVAPAATPGWYLTNVIHCG